MDTSNPDSGHERQRKAYTSFNHLVLFQQRQKWVAAKVLNDFLCTCSEDGRVAKLEFSESHASSFPNIFRPPVIPPLEYNASRSPITAAAANQSNEFEERSCPSTFR